MAFKDEKGEEKFLDLTNRFSMGRNNSSNFSSTDVLKKQANLSNVNVENYMDALQAQMRVNETASLHNNLFVSGERKLEFADNVQVKFIENTAEIYTEEGYNIQSDNLEENETSAKFVEERRKKVNFFDNTKKSVTVAIKPTVKYGKEDVVDKEVTFTEREDILFTDKKESFQADKKSLFKNSDKNVCFDYENSGENFVNVVSSNEHSELENQSTLMFVEGVDITENLFDRNEGFQVKTKIKKEKIAGHKGKTTLFVNKAEKIFEDVSLEGNETAVLNVDDKVIAVVSHSANKQRKISLEYSQIQNEIEDIKKEPKNDEKVFKESVASFSSREDKFTDRYTDSFKKEFTDVQGNSIFESTKKQKKNKNKSVVIVQKKAARRLENESKINSIIKIQKNQAKAESRFEVFEKSEEKTGSGSKKMESYFGEGKSSFDSDNKAVERFLSKNEKFDQTKIKEREEKREKEKKLKKAAVLTALSNVLETKKNIQNEFGDMSGENSGDLIKEGKKGLLKIVTDITKGTVQQMVVIASKKLLAIAASACATVLIPVFILMVCFILMSGTTGALAGADSDSGEEYDLNLPGGDGVTFSHLSASEIDQIIEELWASYPDDMTSTRETVLRYALSKVGCAYDQNYHGSLSVDIFDCSSLAYRSYREVGIEIRNGDAYTAAEECRAMENQNKVVGNHLVPGDLIFYGGADNGRYKGVYHVAIYVGSGKMVEAKGKSYGVVYGDVRNNNVVVCARPTL